MLKKFIEYIRPKYIGLNISDGQLTAMEIGKGIFITENIADPSGTVPLTPVWHNPTVLKTLVKKVFKAAGIRIWTYRPVVVAGIPADTTKPDNKMIYDTIMNAGAKSTYLLDDFLMAALGTGVYKKTEGPVYHKKIYVLIQKETTYLGIILAGGTFELKTIGKGYDNLTKDDLQSALKGLLDNFPTKVPDQFHHRAISKEVAEELEKAWCRKMEKQVYLTAPERFIGHWGEMMDGYWLVYTGQGEQAIIRGIEEFLPAVVVKSNPIGPKPISPIKIYIFLILLIVIVILYSLRR